MRFDSDVFISYAHLDNQELMEGHKGWVANFHRALEIRVSQLLGAQPQIWRDPKLKGSDFFENTLLERLKRVGVLLSVVSPRYLKSDWTKRELIEFWKNAEQEGGVLIDGRSRVFKVMKTPVPVDAQPPQLQKMLGYEFFRVDPESGRVRELDQVFGPEAQRDFWMKVDDVAHDLSALLEAIHQAEHVPDEPKATVFLAEVTSDLQAEYETIRRDLQEQGCTVLPNRPLPLRGKELQEFLAGELDQCDFSIHLVGRSYGIVPEGVNSSVAEIQNEFAVRRGLSGRFGRLIWMPEKLESDDLRQQIFIEHARSDERVLTGADLLETSLEDFRTVLRTRIEEFRPPAPPPVEVPAVPAAAAAASAAGAASDLSRVYLVCDQRDQDAVGPWTDYLYDQGFEVLSSVFEGDETEIREYHEESLKGCDGVLIYYGAGNEMWLRRKLREVQKSAGYGREQPMRAVGICVVPPMSPAKAQFRTREALVMAQPDGFAPETLQPFVASMKDGGGPRSQ